MDTVKPDHDGDSSPRAFWQDEGGQDLVEYSLLLAFLVLTVVALLNSTGASLRNLLQSSVSQTANAISMSQS